MALHIAEVAEAAIAEGEAAAEKRLPKLREERAAQRRGGCQRTGWRPTRCRWTR